MQEARILLACWPITLKRRDVVIFIIICGLALLIVSFYANHDILQRTQILISSYLGTGSTEKSIKQILLYNEFFGAKDWGLGEGDTVFKKLRCPVSDCYIVSDKGKFIQSAAVVFHVPRMGLEIPKGRPKEQIWIFYSWESPVNVRKLPDLWRHQFNWSLTYHRQSDFFMPFGDYEKREIPQPRNWTNVVLRKTKAVAWFSSSCKTSSKRMEYVNRMRKIIPVDIWGRCGPNKCGLNKRQTCLDLVNSTYKFYLAFENSFCEDYVTEKFFRYSMYDVIDVVRGGGNYSAYAPPNSFINTADFNSPEDLAKYLKHLDETPSELVKYLQWKDIYYTQEYDMDQPVWCDICRQLHHGSDSGNIDPYNLWFDEERCWAPTDI